jgi:expansin (peptidoglycan-binding protein)
VLSVQWFFSGTWYQMNRVGDNYFVMTSINEQALILPAQIKVTSIFGDTVIDTIPTSKPTVRT